LDVKFLDVSYLNAFIKAASYVFSEITGIRLERGKPFVKAIPFSADAVAVVVGLAGDVRGQVVYSIPGEYAKQIAALMCGGMELADLAGLDELTTSALAELCNMISGQAVMLLNETTGKKAMITPPTVLVGGGMQVFVKPPTLCIPFLANGKISFEINYSLS